MENGWVARRAGCAFLALFAVCPAVSAEPADGDAERRALLDRAEAARAAGRHAEALEDADRAGAMKMTSSVRRFIAEELAALGQNAKAYEAAKECAEEAAKESPSANHDAVFLGCRELILGLAPKVARVTPRWTNPAPSGAALTVNDEPVDIGTEEAAVEPGTIRARVTAPGYRPFDVSVEVAAGDDKVLELNLVKEAEVPVAPVPAVSESRPISSPNAGPGSPRAETKKTALPLGPTIATGAGAALAVTGAILFLVSDSKYRSFKSECAHTQCSPGTPEEHQIDTLDTWSNVTLWSGLSVLAAGGVWWFLDARAHSHEKTGVSIRIRPLGVDVSGRF